MTRQSTPKRNRSVMNQGGTLQEKAMLVRFIKGTWMAKVQAKDVSEKAELEAGAKHGTLSSWKKLIDCPELTHIHSIENEAYAFHKENTLPWFDKGFRILTSANYNEYEEKMREYKDRIDDAKQDFFKIYPKLIDKVMGEAKRDLGSLYDEDDYPTLDEVKNKFYVKIRVLPLPKSDDFRVTGQGVDAEQIRKDIEDQMKETTEIVIKELWERLIDLVSKLQENMADKKGRVFDCHFNNLEKLIDLLPKLNVTGDQNLDDVRRKIDRVLCTIDPDDVREDKEYKKEVADDAKEILDIMKDYAGF